jgi:hypothetical protein
MFAVDLFIDRRCKLFGSGGRLRTHILPLGGALFPLDS